MPGSTLASQGTRLSDGKVRVSLSFSVTSFTDVYEGSDKIDNVVGSNGRRDVIVAEANIQVSPKVRIDLSLPVKLVSYDTTVAGLPESFNRRGLSDVSALVVWTPWGDGPQSEDFFSASNISFAAGLKFPTGKVSTDGVSDVPAKLGSGSLDLILGVAYRAPISDEFSLFASVFLTLNGPEGPPETPDGSHIFDGDRWRLRFGASYRPWEWLFLSLSIDTEITGQSKLDADPLGASGGTIVSLTPGVSVRLFEHVDLFVGVAWPVYRHVNESQLVDNETWSFGIAYTF